MGEGLSATVAKGSRLLVLERYRLLAAVVVVALHTRLLADVISDGYLLSDGVARLAVPYFAALTGYFVGTRVVDDGLAAWRKWSMAVLRVYLALFPLYAPFFFWRLWLLAHDSLYSTLVAVPLQVFLTGYAYHLWYLPGMIYALFLASWLVRRNLRPTLVAGIAAGVYLTGSLGTTWAWVFPDSLFGRLVGFDGLRFLLLLFPMVVGGILLRRLGERFTKRAAWIGLGFGTLALVFEASVAHAHGSRSENLFCLPLITLCGLRLLLARPAPSESSFPFAKASSLVYYFHLFPVLVLSFLTRTHPIGSIPAFVLTMVATTAMVAVVLRTKLLATFA